MVFNVRRQFKQQWTDSNKKYGYAYNPSHAKGIGTQNANES